MYYFLPENSFLKAKPNEKMLSVVMNGTRANIVINEEAYDILKCCDGTKSYENILDVLSEQYVLDEEMVRDFIDKNVKSGIICETEKKAEIKRDILKGDNQIYYPDSLIWEVTNVCPLRCKHCYLGGNKNIWFKQSDIDKIIEMIKEKGITTIQLTGGELFSHPHVEYIVDRLNELDITLALSTSGYILNDAVKRVIKKLKADAVIRVSLDGDEEYHNKVRGRADAYKRVVQFMKYVREQGIQLQVGTVVFDQTEKMMNELILFARSMGVAIHSFSVVIEEGAAHENKQKSVCSNMELQRKLKEWSRLYDTDEYKIQTSQNNGMSNCGCGYKLVRLQPDFSITPCPMIEYKLGNLEQESIEEIMTKGTRIFEKIYSPKNEECTYCTDCICDEECGDCIAMALVMNRKIGNKCKWVQNNRKALDEIVRGD